MARTADQTRRIVLTGAAGLLGRYLLRDLLLAGHRVTAIVRDSRTESAAERVAAVMALWEESLGYKLPSVRVVAGDLTLPRIGLTAVEHQRLATWCDAVVHPAASLAFRPTPGGEPRTTNVDGTANLLAFCRRTPRPEFHHVSTAYVCGETTNLALEDGPVGEPVFNNVYERSKFDAEQLVRDSGIRATVYRPPLIVGDSRTGYSSSYEGMYRLIELAARMAEPDRDGRRYCGRLPWTGDEPRNLVPVDWVSRTLLELFRRPACHGRTYHLVPNEPVPVRRLQAAAEAAIGASLGVFAGSAVLDSLTPLEAKYLDLLKEYVPYLAADPTFDRSNLDAALPGLPDPELGCAALERMLRFAIADDWGRRGRSPKPVASFDCADYMERFFPAAERSAGLSRSIRLTIVLNVAVCGPGGGAWSCRWVGGDLIAVTRGHNADADARFDTDAATFAEIVAGRLSPHEAFFTRRLQIDGDVEAALKLGVLFGQFLKRAPYRPAAIRGNA